MEKNSTLIKFAKKEHLLQIQEEGLLYMNNLPYIWNIEDNMLRGDKDDGIQEVKQGTKGDIFDEDGYAIPFKISSWKLRFPPDEPEKINMFCMFALRPSKNKLAIDKRNYEFGKSVLILTNPNEFIYRLSDYIRKNNIHAESDLVEYYTNNYSGNVGVFRKSDNFAHQSEWRFVCYKGPGKVRKLRIGNLKNISTIIPCTEIEQRLSIDSIGMIHIK